MVSLDALSLSLSLSDDQIFNLYAIAQEYLRKKGQKLYVVFIDFRKAFNSVRYNKHLDCTGNQGIRGHVLVLLGLYITLYFLIQGLTASTMGFSGVLLVFVKDAC